MKILTLNCGSSSVKFQLIETDLDRIDAMDEIVLSRGSVEKLGLSPAFVKYEKLGVNPLDTVKTKGLPEPYTNPEEITTHNEAIERCITLLTEGDDPVIKSNSEVEAVGHRIVHGGEEFKKSQVVTDKVVDGIRRCVEFAPLHNPHNLKGYDIASKLLPGIPQVAVFDTSFHQSMPKHAFLYGLPYDLYQRHGVRRYGFHGTSHRFVNYRLSRLLGKSRTEMKTITCHLGNGCSMAAINGGDSVETTMGFTPLEGLLMGTRAGDLDGSLIMTLLCKEALTLAEANALLNKQSGLIGISGVSSDMRNVQEAAGNGNERAQLAVDMFCYRIKKYIGAYAAVMDGVDQIIFTGGIGENSIEVREKCCEGLSYLGVEVDHDRNQERGNREGPVHADSSRVGVHVIPTNEELVIARDTVRAILGVEMP